MQFMKPLFSIIIIFFVPSLKAQDSITKYYFKKIGWTIELPGTFKLLDSVQNAASFKRGEKAMEKTLEMDIDVSETKTLISAKKKMNYFNATLTPFNPLKDGSYAEANKLVKEVVFNTMKNSSPKAKIDSVSSKITIDGLNFEKFSVTIELTPAFTMTMIILSKLYNGFDFGITYVYNDAKTREEIEQMLRNSKFSK